MNMKIEISNLVVIAICATIILIEGAYPFFEYLKNKK